MSGFLEEKRREIRERMEILREAVDEYAQLDAALRALGGDSLPLKVATATPAPPRAPRGENKAKVLEAVAERPGATVSELSEVSGVPKQLIYNVTRSAIEREEIVREELPSGGTGFRLAGK